MGKAAALLIAGMATLGLTDNLVRLIADAAGLWQFHLLRTAMALPLLGLAALGLGLRLRPLRPGAVILRSGVQALAMLLYFAALPMLPIATVGAALFTAPLWVLILSAAWLGRRITPRQWAAVALGFLGALTMLRPDPADFSPVVLLPLAAGALYGVSNLVTRELCAEEPVGALVAGFFAALGLVSIAALTLLSVVEPPALWVEAAPFLLSPWRAPEAMTLVWILAQAVGSLAAMAMVARAYQSGETAALSVFEYSFLLSASFWAWLLWGQTLAPVEMIGIAMILASGAIMAGVGTGRGYIRENRPGETP
jgi:drug/metabolite transporter (DMT)-like permease